MKASSSALRNGSLTVLYIACTAIGWLTGASASTLFLAIMVSSLYYGDYPSLIAIGVCLLGYGFSLSASPRMHPQYEALQYVRLLIFASSALLVRYLIRSRLATARQYRLVVDTVPITIISVDEKCLITDANPTAREMFGYEIDELISRPLTSILPELKLEQYIRTEMLGIRKGGTQIWVEIGFRYVARAKTPRGIGFIRDISEQRRAKAALLKSQQDMSLLLEMLPGFVWSEDPEGIFNFISQSFLDYTGTTKETLTRSSVMHPEDMQTRNGKWLEMGDSGTPQEDEFRIRRADGVYHWFHARTRPLRDENGQIIRWYGLLWDIEERKRAEASLKASEHELRLMVASIPGMVLVADVDGRLEYANRRVQEFMGRSLEDLRERGCWEGIHPEDAGAIGREWSRCVSSGDTFHAVYRERRFDGEYVWADNRLMPLLDDKGHIVKWYGLITDVDAQHKADQALRKSEANVRLIIDTVPALIWGATPDGEPEFINKRMAEYTGRSLPELGSKNHSDLGNSQTQYPYRWTEVVHPGDLDSAYGAWLHSLETGESYGVECRFRRHDGHYRWFRSLAEPLVDEDGAIVKWYGVYIDIDESRRTKLELQITQATLARAAQTATIAELSASIAHELNQPLTAAITNADACIQWLSTSPPNVEQAIVSADTIVHDVRSAAEIVRRTKALFQHAPLVKTPISMNEIVADVLQLLSGKIRQSNVSVLPEFQKDMPLILADRLQIQQVLFNLIQNGIEAMEEPDRKSNSLTIRTFCDGNSILVEVEDHGCGIEDADGIFEPFFTTKKNGMGMGLSISHSIIEAHQGRLWVESKRGEGATFRFTIPIV
jgi:PAS domain S-box-containing protein